MKHLHVTGCRRSGTTLLFEMLATCFQHEDHCEHEQSIFDAPLLAGNDDLYFSKKPSDITHARAVFEQDPNLYLLYVRRDPRAVITSIHPSRADVYYASFERWLRYESAAQPLLDHPRFHLVHYETLVTEPDRVQAELQEKFPFLAPLHDFSKFHDHANTSRKAQISLKGLRPVSADSLENWRNHLPRIRFQLDRYPILSQTLIDYGYETDDSWLSCLEGIRAKPQRYGEQPAHFFKRLESNLRYQLKSHQYLKARR